MANTNIKNYRGYEIVKTMEHTVNGACVPYYEVTNNGDRLFGALKLKDVQAQIDEQLGATNDMKLKSRGREEVYLYGDKFNRTVYYTEDGRYFVKYYGELIEVYHKAMNFSTSK